MSMIVLAAGLLLGFLGPADGSGGGEPMTLATATAPLPNIINGPCHLVCRPNRACNIACYDDDENETDCGSYGVCTSCGIFRETSRTQIGAHSLELGLYCRHYVSYDVTYANDCGETFTRCEERQDHEIGGFPVFCCGIWRCYGQRC
jgi:hypothetical protein